MDKYFKYYQDRYTGKLEWVEVPKARPITVPGYEAHEFFAFKDPDFLGYWTITEARTGARIWSNKGTRTCLPELAKEAAQYINQQMAKLSMSFAALIDAEVAKYGLSPRYPQS